MDAGVWRRVIVAWTSTLWTLNTLQAQTADTEGGATFRCWSTPVEPYLLTHPCFSEGRDVLCRCSNTTLDCSSSHGRLGYVPRVMRDVKILNFSTNGLRQLDDARFFANVSRSLELLDLFNNNMTFITPDVFRPMRKLSTVLLGGNLLRYDDLRPVFGIPTLRALDLKCAGLGVIPRGYFNVTPSSRLQMLDLSWNNVGSLDMHVLQPLERLTHFKLWHNKLYQLQSAYLPWMENLSFHRNRLFDFPATCRAGSNASLFPHLTHLNLDFNVISAISDPVCLPRLTILQMQYNRMMYFTPDMFSAARFPALQNVGVNEMENRVIEINAYTFNNSILQKIDLGYNNVDFNSSAFSGDVLRGCTGLTHLYLNQNNFQSVSTAKLQCLFRPLQNLEVLYMAEVKLAAVTSDTFVHLPRLKSLYLYGNSLSVVPDGAFDQLPRLVLLSLGKNSISTISSQTFSHVTRHRLTTLDLGGNPFQCGCDIIWFQQWMRERPEIFQDHEHAGYRCSNVRDILVQDYFISDQACLLDTTTSILIISFLCFLFLLFLLFLVLFGYRWHIRLWIYALCRGRQERSRRQAERRSRGFRHDVFLAYAEEDMEWVMRELLPVLEQQWRLRVCVHQRDFLPGKHIVDNISDCLDVSDRVMMVFSTHFARSPWCQFELKYCQSLLMDRDDVMVLLMLPGTWSRDASGAMLAVLRTTTYLEWGEEEDARASFWGRLQLALSDVLCS